jgi:hypothetical protein
VFHDLVNESDCRTEAGLKFCESVIFKSPLTDRTLNFRQEPLNGLLRKQANHDLSSQFTIEPANEMSPPITRVIPAAAEYE